MSYNLVHEMEDHKAMAPMPQQTNMVKHDWTWEKASN